MTKVCKKHIVKPAMIYGKCVGCELERLHSDNKHQQELIEQKDAEIEYRKKYEGFLKSCISCGETLEHSGYDKFERWLEKYRSVTEQQGTPI